MYSIIENVISQWESGLYSARGVKFVVNFFLVLGSIEINPISRGTLKHSLPLIFCAFYVECWFPIKFFTPPPPPSNRVLLILQHFLTNIFGNTSSVYTSTETNKQTPPLTGPQHKQTNTTQTSHNTNKHHICDRFQTFIYCLLMYHIFRGFNFVNFWK